MTSAASVAVTAAITVGFVVVAVLGFEDREKPGAIPFVVLAAVLAVMTVGVAVARANVLSGALDFYPLFVPFVFASLTWLALAFDYTGRGPVVTRRLAAGLAAFGVVVVAVTRVTTVVPDSMRPLWTLVVNVVQLSLIVAIEYAAVLVARSAFEYGDVSLGGTLALSAVGGGLFFLTVVQVLTPPLAAATVFAASEVLLGVIVALLLIAQVRYRVFETGASAGHLARESVLDQMSAAVAITGREDRLLDLNRTAERTFDVSRPEDVGAPIDEALGFDPAPSGADQLVVETSEGRREFESERSELTGPTGERIGRAYVLRDVTERRTHEQRLDVLNRVLRHNLRNDLDAIRGFAETMEREDAAADDAVLAAQIRRTADDVADLGRTLSTADRLLEAQRLDVTPVDVEEVLTDVADAVGAAHPRASVTAGVDGSAVTLRTDRRILRAALDEVVENGIEHNDTDAPEVALTARRDDDAVVVEVTDDGPGIPARERGVLLEGEERPLRHGSGLGLWLVYWGVTRLGGTLAFREREPRGSVVSIRLPDR